MAGLASYRRQLSAQAARLRLTLACGKGSAFELALERVTWEVMHEELDRAPQSVLAWERAGADPATGLSGPERWARCCVEKAARLVRPQYGTEQQLARKRQEYLELSIQMLSWGKARREVLEDRQAGRQYLVWGEHPLVGRVMALLSAELLEWFRAQPNTRELVEPSARAGLATMLTQRPDLVALVRLTQRLPLDAEASAVAVERPAVVTAVGLAIALVPVVGNLVAAYEAWSGVDVFGYRLSPLERGILGASVLLPVAGRLAKAGRALYSESRLVALYGRDAAGWSRALAASAQGAAQRPALQAVAKAEKALLESKRVGGALAKDAAQALPRLVQSGTPLVRAADDAVAQALARLQAAHPQLAGLDAHCLQRVLEKAPLADHMKGQLLEEMIETRLVPWLRTREAGFALGIAVPAGKKLEFIPGHLIRDLSGWQITDGILAYREQGRLVIAAVFEAKAGKAAARELGLAGSGVSRLTRQELAQWKKAAVDAWRDQRDAALGKGQPFGKTLADVEKEFVHSERGGQVRRDVERLYESRLRVADQEVEVVFSPARTKFFGVLPKDVPSGAIEAQLRQGGFPFEILGVDIRSQTLQEICESLVSLAERLAQSGP